MAPSDLTSSQYVEADQDPRRRNISNQKSSAPGDNVRQAINDLEKQIDNIATDLFGTDAFARTANSANALSARLQKGLSDHMSQRLATFNMPSREDVTAIGQRLMVMDERLMRIEEILARLAPAETKTRAAGPPRTRKPRPKAAAAKAKPTPKKKAASKKAD
jgi:hypothetical protein